MSLITTTNAVTMSSREIAELTGKRHDNVIADIRKMLLELGYQIDADGRSPDFSGDVPDAYGRLQHCFNLPRREVEILLTGYSIPLRAKCLDRLHELEARAKQTLPALPGDYIQALEHLLESKRSEQKASKSATTPSPPRQRSVPGERPLQWHRLQPPSARHVVLQMNSGVVPGRRRSRQ